MGLFSRSKKQQGQPQPDSVDALMDALMAHGADFAKAHGLGHTPGELAQVDRIVSEVIAQPLSDQDKELLHRQVTGYLYQTIIANYPDRWGITVAPDNPIVLVVGDQADRVQVLGWQKVIGRMENGDEDNLQFFYAGIAQYADQPGVHTLM